MARKMCVTEVLDLLKAYARQELLEPLRGAPRWIGMGLAGSFAIALGLVMLLLAGLRALQTETGTVFAGNLSWVPYLIAVAALLAVIAALAAQIPKRGLD